MNKYEDRMKQDRQEIEEFVLDLTEGTKAMKKDFHDKAVNNKNKLIKEKLKYYNGELNKIGSELLKSKLSLLPEDKNIDFDKFDERLKDIREILIMNNSFSCWKDKLSLKEIITRVNDGNSDLLEINESIKTILTILKNAKIEVSKEDFKYSSYVYTYMDAYLSGKDIKELSKIFEKIYWSCPDIVMHIRLALRTLIRNHKKELKEYIPKRLDELCKKLNTKNSEAAKLYKKELIYIENIRRCDEYTMAKKFLNKELNPEDYLSDSTTRKNIFDKHLNEKTFDELVIDDKNKFYRANEEMGNLIDELANYNFFKIFIDETVNRLKNKESFKDSVKNKTKEISQEEKKRAQVVAKMFPKKTLFGTKDATITPDLLVKQNNIIKNISKLYLELKVCEVNEDIAHLLNDSSTICDVLKFVCGHYYFFAEIFEKLKEKDENLNIDEVYDKLCDFTFCPFNEFINKTCAIEEFDPINVITRKYSLLGYSISETDLTEGIETLKNDVEFVKTCLSFDNSNLDFEDLVLINKIDKLGLD